MKTALISMVADSTAEDLRRLMAEYRLTYADVAQLCCVSPKAVESWLADPKAAMFRKMPTRHLVMMWHQLPSFLGKRRTAERAAAKKKWRK